MLTKTSQSMEQYFSAFRKGIIGIDAKIPSPGKDPVTIVYADWIASGRNYLPIETRIQEEFMPLVANTHTETSATGAAMTYAYHTAQKIIKEHVNASSDDLIITAGSGMTRLVNKFQRILGVKLDEHFSQQPPEDEKPVVFITHMEHHSNQTSWFETIVTVEIIEPTEDGLVDLNYLSQLLIKYEDRALKIASVTACSNVTGISAPYHKIAEMMHEAGGFCFVDFACSAPYADMDMHPKQEGAHLDAIFFSPHKFLGGPGSTGVLIFNRQFYNKEVPDNPGGGTVDWTNPWGGHKYIDDIEVREDGGTPAFLQTIKTAMCIKLKEEMGSKNLIAREHELLNILWDKIEDIPNLHILAPKHRDRIAIVSFYIDNLHYNLGVRLLNDKFGIQSRGGCSCAGTYGHYLLHVDPEQSRQITEQINHGDFSSKPGWIRVSLHPTMTDAEVEFIADSITELALKHQEWGTYYDMDLKHQQLSHLAGDPDASLKENMTNAFNESFVRLDEHVPG
jgi:selenocysteine lyase/cysteine desulfurase